LSHKILVVEDDETLREVYALKLSMEGFEVETAGDGMDALAQAEKITPDLIILDMMMPRMDGIEFLRLYSTKNGRKAAKVLVASNKTISQDIDEAKQLGASDYLVKSQITPDELVRQVRKHLAKDGPAI
jgi:DNA-binding response OmpR family regulator